MDNDLRYLYNSRPPSSNYDHSQGPPEAINPQGSFNRPETQPRFQWAPHAAGLPQPYPHPIQPATLPDQYMAHAGGLPPPYIGFHGAPGPDVLSGGFSNRLFYYPPHRLSVHSAVPNPSHQSPPSSQGQALDGGSLNQPPSSLGDRAPNIHQPLPTPNNPSTAPPSMQAASSQPPQPSPSFAPLTQSFTPFTSSYRRHHHSPSARSYPMDGSHNTIPRQPIMPMGSRRAARSRRAANTATSRASESAIDEYEDLRQIAYDRMSRLAGNLDRQTMEEVMIAHAQELRANRHKQAATSSKSIQSLQSVNLQDLPADERNCCICYNEFGVPSPEGITESPLRMPRCQHVFGDTCIKKWLEGSDTCPYCRDKIEPEPKHKNQSTARTFVNLLRVRGLAGPHGGPPDSSAGRSVYGREQSESNPRAGSAERRSPSEDFEEPSRRIRQRRHNPTRDEGDMPHIMQGRPPSIPSTPVLVASHLVSGSVNMESPALVDGLPSTMQLSAASRNPLSPSAPHFWPTDYSQRQMGIRESVHLSVDINAQQALPNPLRFSGGASLSGPRNNENARPQFLPNGEENPDSIEVAP